MIMEGTNNQHELYLYLVLRYLDIFLSTKLDPQEDSSDNLYRGRDFTVRAAVESINSDIVTESC